MNDDARIIFVSLFLDVVRVRCVRFSTDNVCTPFTSVPAAAAAAAAAPVTGRSVKCTRSLKNKLLCTWVGFMFLFQTH